MQNLTPHQHQLIKFRLEGLTNLEIAKQIHNHPSAVDYHFTQIYKKLHIKRFAQLPYAYHTYRAERKLRPIKMIVELVEEFM